jgi:hypothetical protein
MRSRGLEIPPELISTLLQLKLLPDGVRRQIAKDLVPKSDTSIASDEEDSAGNSSLDLVDVRFGWTRRHRNLDQRIGR